jgi:hypothetical protein
MSTVVIVLIVTFAWLLVGVCAYFYLQNSQRGAEDENIPTALLFWGCALWPVTLVVLLFVTLYNFLKGWLFP